jgi:hypothetical protein
MNTNDVKRKEIFSAIYEEGAWGQSKDPATPFYSGSGSHDASISSAYIQSVHGFLGTFSKKPSAVDFGCGDFAIGSQIRPLCGQYIACDIVPKLIDFNKNKYQNLDVDFRLVDLVSDDHPRAEIVFIRQVLQHLSNLDIQQIIPKIKANYKYLVLTEHLPSTAEFPHNKDIPTGSDFRLNSGSGVVITSAPFNLDAAEEHVLCEIPQYAGVIRTTLYKLQE